jgi:hypothetical protein
MIGRRPKQLMHQVAMFNDKRCSLHHSNDVNMEVASNRRVGYPFSTKIFNKGYG